MLPVPGLHIGTSNMGIDHRCVNLFMPQQFTDVHDGHATLHSHCCRGMSEDMRSNVLRDFPIRPDVNVANNLLDGRRLNFSDRLPLRYKEVLAIIIPGGQVVPERHFRLCIDVSVISRMVCFKSPTPWHPSIISVFSSPTTK